ncbi:MAG: VOC family protein [Planctomycetes bacterium]|nr:VOC family protein [Planctomycetota bacterium]
MSASPPFHLAFPVRDVESTRAFYAGVLGCPVGREAERWIDFDFFGHQLSAHVAESDVLASNAVDSNAVDGDDVPVRHFGVVLSMERWHALRERLRAAGAQFLIEPKVRFVGEVGEQATLFVRDPSGNALEFKAFADPRKLFQSSSP